MEVICNKLDDKCKSCSHKEPHVSRQTGSEWCTESGYCLQKDVMVRCIEVGDD